MTDVEVITFGRNLQQAFGFHIQLSKRSLRLLVNNFVVLSNFVFN
jgi:hypothetical protein